jgi:hypothetical protein
VVFKDKMSKTRSKKLRVLRYFLSNIVT